MATKSKKIIIIKNKKKDKGSEQKQVKGIF